MEFIKLYCVHSAHPEGEMNKVNSCLDWRESYFLLASSLINLFFQADLNSSLEHRVWIQFVGTNSDQLLCSYNKILNILLDKYLR